MKTKFSLLIFIISALSVVAQTASDYFPSQTGYKWYFESVPLDSLNNPVNSLKFFGIDSFTVVTPYFGRTANLVLTKTGAQNTINFQPYLDSIYFSFETTNGFEYFYPVNVAELLGTIDTTLNINFLNFFYSLKGWYPYYKLASSINQSYQIFKKDTTVTFDSTSLPLRFELIGKRLSDETINTAIGTFDCKKFLLERRLSYLITIPPFPTIAIKILGVEETAWLAPANWKVKSYIPSTNVDFSFLGISAFTVPGLETNITTAITSIGDEYEVVNDFELYQNFPNPFNPSTKIKYTIPNVGIRHALSVQLKVYDVLGNEVAILVDEYEPAGNYEVEFQSSVVIRQLASGIYFYQLKVDNFIQSRKMVLLK